MISDINPTIVAFVVGVLITNIGAILAAYISIIVKITRLEVKADGFNKDLNNAWKFMKLKIDSNDNNKETGE